MRKLSMQNEITQTGGLLTWVALTNHSVLEVKKNILSTLNYKKKSGSTVICQEKMKWTT